jgi:ribonuclease Z
MMKLYDWKKWPNFFQVTYNRLPDQEMSLAISLYDLKIYSSPVKHLIPTIGLRFEFIPEEKAAAYSCDTEPCPQVVRLGDAVDILIHEATGAGLGHSSPAQAAQVGRDAKAHSLVLIHYASQKSSEILESAKGIFNGPILLAEDMMQLEL